MCLSLPQREPGRSDRPTGAGAASGPRCLVWQSPPVEVDDGWLDAVERRRRDAYHHAADRARFATGVYLQRQALAWLTGTAVGVTRRCPGCGARDHGPTAPGHPWDRTWSLSVAHSGRAVVLAVVRSPVVVGVDVERVHPRSTAVARMFLTDAELELFHAAPEPDRALAVSWTRKEAVLKAARVGLTVSMTSFEVGDPAGPARVRGWGGTPMRVVDLPVPARHVGAVAVTGSSQPDVVMMTLRPPGNAPLNRPGT